MLCINFPLNILCANQANYEPVLVSYLHIEKNILNRKQINLRVNGKELNIKSMKLTACTDLLLSLSLSVYKLNNCLFVSPNLVFKLFWP